ncbi:uncharacterized protein LOC119076774 [Bradysia coprophila]|uniref:uncharacterized protein LOC119076774 n=1 Tax=Bradysia coprophila TaxID=38358 RepID=UPI00187DB17A|nr:uncharacterized protein LOC119076774 [Bradysia coprophila]
MNLSRFAARKLKKTFLQCQSGMRIELHKKDLGASLFASRNEHNCSQLTQAASKLTPEVRQFITELHARGLKLKAVQDEFIKAKKPLPARSVLANEIARLRRMDTSQAVIKLSELHDLLKQHSTIPEDECKAYVVDFKIADENEVRFDFVVSSKKLLDLNTRSQVCNADTTYNLVWQGYPVQVTGHTDFNKKFHPSAISVSTNEDEETYAFIFQTLKDGTNLALSKDLKQSILMADGAKAISNGFHRAFGSDFTELMCWYHAKTAMKDNITHLVPKEHQERLLQDIDRLQLSQTPAMFDKASVLFLEKYSKFTEFVDYFAQQWLHLHRNWYEVACVDRDIKAPGTNNGLELLRMRKH